MEKYELLKSLGFSSDFLKKLDEYENIDTIKFEQLTFDTESFKLSSSDSTKLHIKEKQISTDKLFVTGT